MPVASQMAEVKRVFAILKGQADDRKVAVYGAILLRLSESFNERTDYREWVEKGNAAELARAKGVAPDVEEPFSVAAIRSGTDAPLQRAMNVAKTL